jgi:TolA-binding protein
VSDAQKPLSEMSLAGREEVRDSERWVTDARVEAVSAKHAVHITRLEARFRQLRLEIEVLLEKFEQQITGTGNYEDTTLPLTSPDPVSK